MTDHKDHILIVEARFYEDLADELARGAIAAIEARGGTYTRVQVPGWKFRQRSSSRWMPWRMAGRPSVSTVS